MHQPSKRTPTKQAQMLYDALCKRGLKAKLEYPDGHKTVDIAILEPKIYIEVDGLHHFTDPHQILADFDRYHYSDMEHFRTFYVTNQILDHYLEEVADALAEVVKKKLEK